ncbi:MAG: rod shape-determining protein MreB, partial [Patescibacteria group bacterium]|nr:rod shape-determining protein MreB [Patescibacteria group bacterium]
FLIEEPMAAAIGARMPIQDASGNMIVDIGGGTTEIAVISLGGVITWRSLRVAGDELDQNIIQYARENFNLLIGEQTAEAVKIAIAIAGDIEEPLETKMRGRDLISGLPREVSIHSYQVQEAIQRSIRLIVENIKDTIESTPPELVADIYERGVFLTGGGALLRNLDKILQRETQIPVHIADDPLTCVVRGAGIVLEDLEKLKDVLTISSHVE